MLVSGQGDVIQDELNTQTRGILISPANTLSSRKEYKYQGFISEITLLIVEKNIEYKEKGINSLTMNNCTGKIKSVVK